MMARLLLLACLCIAASNALNAPTSEATLKPFSALSRGRYNRQGVAPIHGAEGGGSMSMLETGVEKEGHVGNWVRLHIKEKNVDIDEITFSYSIGHGSIKKKNFKYKGWGGQDSWDWVGVWPVEGNDNQKCKEEKDTTYGTYWTCPWAGLVTSGRDYVPSSSKGSKSLTLFDAEYDVEYSLYYCLSGSYAKSLFSNPSYTCIQHRKFTIPDPSKKKILRQGVANGASSPSDSSVGASSGGDDSGNEEDHNPKLHYVDIITDLTDISVVAQYSFKGSAEFKPSSWDFLAVWKVRDCTMYTDHYRCGHGSMWTLGDYALGPGSKVDLDWTMRPLTNTKYAVYYCQSNSVGWYLSGVLGKKMYRCLSRSPSFEVQVAKKVKETHEEYLASFKPSQFTCDVTGGDTAEDEGVPKDPLQKRIIADHFMEKHFSSSRVSLNLFGVGVGLNDAMLEDISGQISFGVNEDGEVNIQIFGHGHEEPNLRSRNDCRPGMTSLLTVFVTLLDFKVKSISWSPNSNYNTFGSRFTILKLSLAASAKARIIDNVVHISDNDVTLCIADVELNVGEGANLLTKGISYLSRLVKDNRSVQKWIVDKFLYEKVREVLYCTLKQNLPPIVPEIVRQQKMFKDQLARLKECEDPDYDADDCPTGVSRTRLLQRLTEHKPEIGFNLDLDLVDKGTEDEKLDVDAKLDFGVATPPFLEWAFKRSQGMNVTEQLSFEEMAAHMLNVTTADGASSDGDGQSVDVAVSSEAASSDVNGLLRDMFQAKKDENVRILRQRVKALLEENPQLASLVHTGVNFMSKSDTNLKLALDGKISISPQKDKPTVLDPKTHQRLLVPAEISCKTKQTLIEAYVPSNSPINIPFDVFLNKSLSEVEFYDEDRAFQLNGRVFFRSEGEVQGPITSFILALQEQFPINETELAEKPKLHQMLAPSKVVHGVGDYILYSNSLMRIGTRRKGINIDKEDIYGHLGFKFEGPTDLTALIQWLTTTGDEAKTFVYNYIKNKSMKDMHDDVGTALVAASKGLALLQEHLGTSADLSHEFFEDHAMPIRPPRQATTAHRRSEHSEWQDLSEWA